MLGRTKKRPTEELVPLHLMVHPAHVAAITEYAEQLEQSESVPWREVAGRRGSVPASVLRGARGKAALTQTRLSELSGIPQRHLSEMERGKRPIGRETARKLAAALELDYRLLL
ncbi:helix-turn-helix domain-containing protein [Geomonas paludis]|uniref:HTH cro/C1-type domain-containing protein n=2 Tax=Geomonas paludis TaxID=2740185 RepID=A0A6V8MU30_9BACT|nr:helix-turn-helix transcriptional regulator [Geomonas paludis]GFO63676.1 hypothetical protein GMPD_15950 [Geomonas paludis]